MTSECNSSVTTPRLHPPPPSSPSTFIPPPLSENMWTVAQWERAERTGGLRREVISAVSPQRFPHSTLISSNNVSQTFQLFRKMGGWKEVSERGKKVENASPSSQLFHIINLSLLTVVSRKWLWWLNCIWGVPLLYIYLKRGLVKFWKCRIAAFLSWDLSLRDDVWNDLQQVI